MARSSSLQRFVETFVAPLILGGRVEVTGLLGPGIVRNWIDDHGLDGTLVARITRVVHDRLARIGPIGSADRLPHDALALAAVWHNVLAMTHPEARTRTSLRRRVKQWCIAILEWVAAPQTRAETALRHGIIGRIGELGRVDTHVTFWAGYADFVGVAAPRPLLLWPNLRRVREDKTRVSLFELLRGLEPAAPDELDQDLNAVVRAALTLSPLTDLALAERPAALAFTWTPASVNAMGDPALRGAAQRGILARGTPAVRTLEQATLDAARRALPPRAALCLLRFHLEMLAMDALAARAGAAPSVPQPLALDAYARLGYERSGILVGLGADVLAQVLALDPARPIPKDPPSATLLACAGLLETPA